MKTYEMNYLFILAFASLLFLTRHRSLAKGKYADEGRAEKGRGDPKPQRSAFAQQKLLSLISHHIRGPFQFVLRMSDLLSNKWKDIQEKERNESVHMIRNSLDEMDRTLRDVIDWARRKQEGEENSSSVMQSGDIVAEEATFLASAARWKDIQIMERVDIDAPVMQTRRTPPDRTKFDQQCFEVRPKRTDHRGVLRPMALDCCRSELRMRRAVCQRMPPIVFSLLPDTKAVQALLRNKALVSVCCWLRIWPNKWVQRSSLFPTKRSRFFWCFRLPHLRNKAHRVSHLVLIA